MNRINLSYVICTYNRIGFIEILLSKLINSLQPEEEIIVVDGNSADGTQEYLQDLYAANKISQYISEPDRNQAHGWNKGFLMAKGTIIKKLIDDDVHDLNAIRKCCSFMLANPEIDICISNNMAGHLLNPNETGITGRLPYYEQWKMGQTKTFTFSDVTMLIRRSSLSFIGLYDTQFKMIDWEYSLRCTYLKAKIAYYTGYNSLSVATPGNVSSTATIKEFKHEESLGKIKYEYPGDWSEISVYSKIKIWVGETYHRWKKRKMLPKSLTDIRATEIEKIYSAYYQKLEEQNKMSDYEFL